MSETKVKFVRDGKYFDASGKELGPVEEKGKAAAKPGAKTADKAE